MKKEKKKLKLNENEREIRRLLHTMIDRVIFNCVNLRQIAKLFFNDKCFVNISNLWLSYNLINGVSLIVQEYPIVSVSRLLNPFSISDYTCSPPKPS